MTLRYAPGRLRPLFIALPIMLTGAASHAGEPPEFSEITVEAAAPGAFEGTALDDATLERKRVTSSDTASLLTDLPGVSVNANGGISSFPAIHGLADDRLGILLDGMSLVSSCPNHMNPPLSYIDPSQVGAIQVWSGVAPVSVGGDAIGGAIVVQSLAPEFAAPGQDLLTKGRVGSLYQTNGEGFRGHASATFASQNLSLNYSGAYATANNYDAGGNFKAFRETGVPGHLLSRDEVGSSGYEMTNHLLSLAMRSDNHLLEAKFGYQVIPDQGYPNQRMDMLDNTERRFNLRYLGQFGWGSLEALGYRETVNHYMDFGSDKKFFYGAPPYVVASGMPMKTDSENNGAKLTANLKLSEADTLRLGGEYQRYRLDDWWPPSPADLTGMLDSRGQQATVGGMAPGTFWNINDGTRERAGLFGEWESRVTARWTTLAGVRYEHVTTSAGPVAGYNTMMYKPGAFNAGDRKRNDANWNLSTIARYTADDTFDLDFGYALKTRSPNLYERYSWSTGVMAQEMNNFVGDGNGYFGDPELKHETAHTVSATADWHTPRRDWEFRATPYYSRVDNYIDAVQWDNAANAPAAVLQKNQFVVLRYTNQDADLYGLDLSGRMPLAETALGSFGLQGLVNYTKGENRATNDDLYNIMPLNGRLTVTQAYASWSNALELVMVAPKHEVSDVRNEIKTSGYSLVNLRGAYTWQDLRVDFGADNIFDTNYDLPTGGAYVGQGATMSFNREIGVLGPNGGTSSMWGIAVPGMGRSLYAGISYSF